MNGAERSSRTLRTKAAFAAGAAALREFARQREETIQDLETGILLNAGLKARVSSFLVREKEIVGRMRKGEIFISALKAGAVTVAIELLSSENS